MDSKQTDKSSKLRKKHNRRRLTIAVLMILLLAALCIVQCQLSNMKAELAAEREAAEKLAQSAAKDSVQAPDTTAVDTVPEPPKDSVEPPPAPKAPAQKPAKDPKADSLAKAREAEKATRDSLAKALRDSLARADSIRKADSIAYANRDSIPPEASIVPPAGRYYEPIQLKVKCDEYKCKTFYSVGDTNSVTELTSAVTYNKTGDVFYFAEDSAGNRSAWQSVHYDMASDNVCGKNAYPVPVGGKTVCVDAYEYPNEAGEVVKDMVSHEKAKQLCAEAGKRLCKFDEWSAACKGKDGTRYSYGNSYKPSKCNANTKAARRAGRKEQCRSWYGMYDMNGNLWEWTDTPAEMPNRYLVAGGAWDTQNASKCTDTKYSFYPQNEYNFVGFRCCKDVP